MVDKVDGADDAEPINSTRAKILPPDAEAPVIAIVIVFVPYVIAPMFRAVLVFRVFVKSAPILPPGVLANTFPPVNSPDKTFGRFAAFAASRTKRIIFAKKPWFPNVKMTDAEP